MNNNQFILSNDAFDYTICPNCRSNNFISFKSKANASYLYCSSCEANKKISLKQSNIDMILYEIKNTLESLSKSLLSNLNIEIFCNNNIIDLFINHIKINQFNFEYSLSEKECYHFKNTILYLINDYTDTSKVEVNFNIR